MQVLLLSVALHRRRQGIVLSYLQLLRFQLSSFLNLLLLLLGRRSRPLQSSVGWLESGAAVAAAASNTATEFISMIVLVSFMSCE